MNKKLIYPLLMIVFLGMSLINSCAPSGEDDIYILKDTVLINQDTLIKEQRPEVKPNLVFVVQLAAFKEQKHVDEFVKTVKDNLGVIADTRKTGDVILITVGKFKEAKAAQDYLSFVKSKGYNNAFIKSFD